MFLGTGKTATFTVGILQRLDPEVKQCQSLVLAPTRELAQQIVKVIGALGKSSLLLNSYTLMYVQYVLT